MEKYDLCIIGAGPSGYAAAMRAVDFGKKIILIESNEIGGAGVKNGALSSKTWWELSREIAIFRKHLAKHNIKAPAVNFGNIKQDVLNATRTRIESLKSHIQSINKQKKSEITYRIGKAKLISKNEVLIEEFYDTEIIYADNIILATGSHPRILPNVPVDEKIILTSDGIENLDRLPESIVILGAGIIGCEFATIFSGFGKTKVNLIDKGDRILPFEDEDIVKIVEEAMEEKGVTIHRNSKLSYIKVKDGRVEYELEYKDGHKEIFNVEKALLAVGRIPNLQGLGLEEVGVQFNEKGIIDNQTQTTVPNIYAIGDLTCDIALVNIGELEGRHAVELMFDKPERDLVYKNISTIMFLDPEVAGVGLNEIEAQEKKIDYCVASLYYEFIPRAIAQRDTRGFIKLLVTNDDEKKILGMRVIGREASSAIQAVALLIFMNKGIRELAECIHPHPSITEGIQECVRLLLGKSIFKPWAITHNLYCRTFKGGAYLP